MSARVSSSPPPTWTHSNARTSTGLVELLTEDVAWTMPSAWNLVSRLDAIIPILVEYPLSDLWRHLPAGASGQLAVGCYLWRAEEQQ